MKKQGPPRPDRDLTASLPALRLTPEQKSYVLYIGEGNQSLGARRCIDIAMQQQKDSVVALSQQLTRIKHEVELAWKRAAEAEKQRAES